MALINVNRYCIVKPTAEINEQGPPGKRENGDVFYLLFERALCQLVFDDLVN